MKGPKGERPKKAQFQCSKKSDHCRLVEDALDQIRLYLKKPRRWDTDKFVSGTTLAIDERAPFFEKGDHELGDFSSHRVFDVMGTLACHVAEKIVEGGAQLKDFKEVLGVVVSIACQDSQIMNLDHQATCPDTKSSVYLSRGALDGVLKAFHLLNKHPVKLSTEPVVQWQLVTLLTCAFSLRGSGLNAMLLRINYAGEVERDSQIAGLLADQLGDFRRRDLVYRALRPLRHLTQYAYSSDGRRLASAMLRSSRLLAPSVWAEWGPEHIRGLFSQVVSSVQDLTAEQLGLFADVVACVKAACERTTSSDDTRLEHVTKGVYVLVEYMEEAERRGPTVAVLPGPHAEDVYEIVLFLEDLIDEQDDSDSHLVNREITDPKAIPFTVTSHLFVRYLCLRARAALAQHVELNDPPSSPMISTPRLEKLCLDERLAGTNAAIRAAWVIEALIRAAGHNPARHMSELFCALTRADEYSKPDQPALDGKNKIDLCRMLERLLSASTITTVAVGMVPCWQIIGYLSQIDGNALSSNIKARIPDALYELQEAHRTSPRDIVSLTRLADLVVAVVLNIVLSTGFERSVGSELAVALRTVGKWCPRQPVVHRALYASTLLADVDEAPALRLVWEVAKHVQSLSGPPTAATDLLQSLWLVCQRYSQTHPHTAAQMTQHRRFVSVHHSGLRAFCCAFVKSSDLRPRDAPLEAGGVRAANEETVAKRVMRDTAQDTIEMLDSMQEWTK